MSGIVTSAKNFALGSPAAHDLRPGDIYSNRGFPPLRSRPLPRGARGNLAQSCSLNSCFTLVGGISDRTGPGLGKIQAHLLHPHAAKVLFSSQTSSLAISEPESLSHSWLRQVPSRSAWLSTGGGGCAGDPVCHVWQPCNPNSVGEESPSADSHTTMVASRSKPNRLMRSTWLGSEAWAQLARSPAEWAWSPQI
jgi:hypothetical protein